MRPSSVGCGRYYLFARCTWAGGDGVVQYINYYMMYTSVSEDQWKNDNSHNAYIHTIQVCIQCVPVVGTHRIIYTLLYYTYICDALSGGTGIFMDFFIPIVCLLSCTLHKTAAACLILLSCDYRCGIPVT